VAENDGLTFAPILIIDLDPIVRFDKAHVCHSSKKRS
jgi:hypothetical protein